MQSQEYYRIERMESTHFWYRGMRQLINMYLDKYVHKPSKILDAGCGTGGFAQECGGLGHVFAIDVNKTAIKFARKKNIADVRKASVCKLPFKNNSFDTVLCLDVIYHQDVPDDQEAMHECFRVLKPGGLFILRVPAFEFLRGSHDIVVLTRKRYTKSEVRTLVRSAGFAILYLTYANMLLSIPLFFKRVFERFFSKNHKPHSDSSLLPRGINWLFELILSTENRLLTRVSLPFGSSVVCVCRKPTTRFILRNLAKQRGR